ncbi:autotransporter domain-containing protein [Alcanivorax sp.]|jgi:fibronectin-binding autotransporter adhesin|uniref:autotransporter domain-containing protein n=1 Tax=Alcanivorax sp. TaxID=1872427 RepID=UPI0032D8EA4B
MSQFAQRHIGGRCLVRVGFYPVSSAVFSFLLLLSVPAWSAPDGADGTGHDGTTGGQGENGSNGSLFSNGGHGGDGMSLLFTGAAPSLSSEFLPGVDWTTDLTTLPGVSNGDQFSVTVDGVTSIITINTGLQLGALGAAIDAVLLPYGMRSYGYNRGSGRFTLDLQGSRNFLSMELANVTGTPLSSTGFDFGAVPVVVGSSPPPFEHGGDGGNGGVGLLPDPGDYYFTFASLGGDGGAGGKSDYYYGDGGNGGDGGAGLHITSPDDRFTLFSGAEFHGGNGGNGGVGGAGGIGGDGGDGAAGIQADASADIHINAGALVQGGDAGTGGGGGTAGADGIGGFGITGSDLAVTLAGTVNAGANQATAIHFAGGSNRLTLENGYSLGGNVQSNGSTDALVLGGAADGTFNTNTVGTASTDIFRGFESFEKTGAGTWTLDGTAGLDWWVREGTLVGANDSLSGNIRNDASVKLIADSLDYFGVISGSGDVLWDVSSETLIVRNQQHYTGLTHIVGGVLDLDSMDTFAGDILLDSGAQLVGSGLSTSTPYANTISGAGGVHLSGSDVTWTADHAFTGGMIFSNGTSLTLGTGGNSGSIVGDLRFRITPGTLIINRGNDYRYAGVLSGPGNLIKNGTGNYFLSADHTMTGAATVNGGGLFVNGAMDGVTATVNNGGLLGGSGSLGNTTVQSGGTLAPGDGLGTLSINGNLTLAQGSLLDFDFGAPGSDFSTLGQSDSVTVNGDLAINGASLNVNDAGGFGPGLYRLFDYTGTLTESNGGLQLAATDPSLGLQYLAANGQINLINATGTAVNFWNGNGLASGSTQGGGDGTWTATNSVWSDAAGSITAPMIPKPGFAVFAGDAGTVTVSSADGAVAVEGMQFASDGYRVAGDGLTLTGADGEIRVGDGSAASSGYQATIDSVISGNNGLMKTGEGTLVIESRNDYVGDTVIAAGTLRALKSESLGDASNRLVLDGGTFHVEGAAIPDLFNRHQLALGSHGGTLWMAQDATVRSDLTGSGALTVAGSRTLNLEGNNDFSGGLIIDGSGVQAEVGGLGTGSIENNGELGLQDAGQAELGNDLSGSGSISMSGGGEVRLTGNNTSFSGQFRLFNGALIGDAEAFGSAAIENRTRLVLDQAADGVFDNALTGSGDLEKTGSGAVSLAQDATAFTGSTVIQQGRLNANSNWSNSAFTVENSGVLGGTGQVGDTTIESGGTLAVGNSIGTLNINGDLTFNSGSQLALEVDPASTSSDRIEVSGQANLAGSVLHVGNDGTYLPFSTYTFLNAAGGINGQFDDVSSNYAFLNPVLSYGSNTASLELLRNDLSFASAAFTDNQRAVANNVDGMTINDSLYRQVLQMSKPQAAQAFTAFSGDSLLASLSVGRQLQQAFANGMRQRGRNVGGHSDGGMDARLSRELQALAAPSDPYAQAAQAAQKSQVPLAASAADGESVKGGDTRRNGVWVLAQSSRFEEQSQSGVGNAAYTFRGDQLALGLDHQWDRWMLGVAAGSADGALDYDNRQADGDVSSWFAGVYGRWSSRGAWYMRGDLSYGNSDVSQQRIVSGTPAESDSSVDALRLALESGWDLAWGETGLHPYAMVSMTRIERNGFSETGGGIAGLAVDDSELNSGEAWLGADLSRAFVLGGDWFVAEGGLAVVQPFGDTQPEQSARFAGTQQGFTVYGADQNDAQLAANAGAEWLVTPDFSLWLGYRGRFGGDTESHGGLLSANLTW